MTDFRTELWIKDQVQEVSDWCDDQLENSFVTLAYGGRVLIFHCREDTDEALFRVRWGHLL